MSTRVNWQVLVETAQKVWGKLKHNFDIIIQNTTNLKQREKYAMSEKIIVIRYGMDSNLRVDTRTIHISVCQNYCGYDLDQPGHEYNTNSTPTSYNNRLQ